MRLLLIALFVAAAPARAQEPASYLDIKSVVFIERPTRADFEEAFPRTTVYVPAKGKVVLDCLVLNDGRLQCDTHERTSADQRLIDIALRASAKFRVATLTGRSSIIGRRVLVPIMFRDE